MTDIEETAILVLVALYGVAMILHILIHHSRRR